MKGIVRFGVKGKLNMRFREAFEVLERTGEVAYKLVLPPILVGVHNMFHISILRKCIPNPSYVIEYESLRMEKDLTNEE